MKKIFLTMMAVTALTACTQDEVMEQNRTPIAFGNAFVDNASRAVDPSYGTINQINSFQVWGQLVGNTGNKVQLYNDAQVYSSKTENNTTTTKEYNEAWWCDQTEYWIPSATYHFGAVANGNVKVLSENGVPAIVTYPKSDVTYNGTQDLVLADSVEVKTDFNANPTTGVSENSKLVAFTFNHLLSKLHFQFENSMSGNERYAYVIKNIKIAGVPAGGTYTVSTQTWTPNTGENSTATINFGHATNSTETSNTDTTPADTIVYKMTDGKVETVTSHYARMIVPCNQELTVTFEKELYYDANNDGWFDKINEKVYADTSNTNAADKQTTIKFTHKFEANGAYVLKVTLKQDNKIEFTVKEVDSWDTDHNNNNQADDDVAIPTPQPAA